MRVEPGTAELDRPATRFALPDDLAAAEPPEARGLARDGVRLLAADGDRIEHARFAELGRFLRPGDLLVVNTSATRAAAVDGRIGGLGAVVVHFAIFLDDGSWVVEIRTAPAAAHPIRNLLPGRRIELPDGNLTLVAPEPVDQGPGGPRLWRTEPLDPHRVHDLLGRHGRPIRYGYLAGQWPLASYQTVFAAPTDPSDQADPGAQVDPGAQPTSTGRLAASDRAGLGASAEMPSAGRPFSTELVSRLIGQGVLFAPITLHAGVSSAESGEPPAAEWFRVPARTAALVNWTRKTGGLVIAVGTTVTRALESAALPRDLGRMDRPLVQDHGPEEAGTQARRAQGHGQDGGEVVAAEGWTGLVLGPQQPVRVVDGLITGLHDPDASHLLLLEAVAGPPLVQRVYDAALDRRYLWHEFGDSCLLLP
jgi:S-adenosylmethionine:tRNA ribosyltransferase-isomerase